MNAIRSILQLASDEILIHSEVSSVLRNIVGAIEMQSLDEVIHIASNMREDIGYLMNLLEEQQSAELKRIEKATILRERVVSEIFEIDRQIRSMSAKITSLDDSLSAITEERDFYQCRYQLLASLPKKEASTKLPYCMNCHSKTEIFTGITQEAAAALSNKLTPQEIKIIAALTDRLKRQSFQIDLLREEKDDIAATLQYTESIKDLLIDKLQSAEITLKNHINQNAALKKNSINDLEILTYLDLQGQEYEAKVQTLQEECFNLRFQSNLERKVASTRLQNLQDENIILQEKLQTKKTEKNVLVKEVKKLRSENNQMASKLQQLRELFL